MKYWKNWSRLLLFLLVTSPLFLHRSFNIPELKFSEERNNNHEPPGEKEKFSRERLMAEFKMLRNPVTGTIPANIRELELQVARNIPSKHSVLNMGISRNMSNNERAEANNNYGAIGPSNIAGRSRTLAFDRRNNQILISGGVTGGIFRSTNGGQNWTFVSPEDDIRSVTSIMQDPANPDTWYCGTGEVYNAASVQEVSVPGTVGHGIFKSTNNGTSWTKLAATADGDAYNFNGFFDLVHRMAVHPTNGQVYAAAHNRIMRSTNGGQSWETVLGGSMGNSALAGITEVIMNSTGSRIYAAFSGENIDPSLVGVWESATGAVNSWTRIAGAPSGAGSVAGWRPYGQWGRVVLALSPTNRLYVLYKNNQSASGSNPQPEADLFRADVSSGTGNYAWTNLNDYVPNEPIGFIEGVNPYTTQFNGFNMSIVVKPDQENILFIGGTVIDRVNLNETDAARKFRRIGGYGLGFFPNGLFYPNHHPDVHGIYFAPASSSTEMFTATDGGLHKTINNMADTVQWQSLNGGFQILQYQEVSLIPETGYDWVIGGAQDNGTLYNINLPRQVTHNQLSGGDGASAAMSKFYKNGNTWRQYWYYSIVQGYILRSDVTWQYNPGDNNLTNTQFSGGNNITPPGQGGNGQWITLFTLDPDSSENLYYNIHNRLFRTNRASTVTSTSWVEMTGVRSTVPDNADITTTEISKASGTNPRYLYFATDAGKLYRINNPSGVSSNVIPADITPSAMSSGSYVAGISINPRNPDTVLAVVSNYDVSGNIIRNIFWSGNATTATPTWQVIGGALEPLSCQSAAIIVGPGGVEYYVGTSVGLFSTTIINGASTSWLNEGSGMMKHAIIRSLYHRVPDNKLLVGTHGNGAFLTNVSSNPAANASPLIRLLFPTLTYGNLNYNAGELDIQQMNIRVFAMNGQELYNRTVPYNSGFLDFSYIAAGSYVIVFSSLDKKYRYVGRFVKVL